MDLRHVHLGNRESLNKEEEEEVILNVELSKEGVQKCEAELWTVSKIHIRNDGTGWLDGKIAKSDIPFFAKFILGLGNEAAVKSPSGLVDAMKEMIAEIMAKYK